ncbi:MAG TPA: AIR synthase-related protein, partial [Methanobacterium sp.]|nr:AIR synthase-related protein [Methanobacterium sp.]
DAELESAEAVLEIIRGDENNAVTAVHDCSSGGIAIAIAEMAISGDLGAAVDLSNVPNDDDMRNAETLFSESNARFVVTVKSEYADEILSKVNAPAAVIGEVRGKTLTINQDLINVDIEKLKESYYGVIEKFMA